MLLGVGVLGAGGVALWLLLRHHHAAAASGGGALPDPLPCPAGWGGTAMPNCQPPACGSSNPAVCPPGGSGADLELALARLMLKTTSRVGYDYGDAAELAALMNAAAPPPMGTVGYARALDALEGVVVQLGVAQPTGQ